MITVPPGERDTFARIERPVPDAAQDGAGSGTWEFVDEEWIAVRDQLPSRGERDTGGLTIATRRARVRMDWRDDITADMRFVVGDRIMQIVSGPAELGRRAGLEWLVEDYTSAGNAA